VIEAMPRLAIRPATAADIATLEALIERSARSLSRGYYTAAETQAAIDHVFGVDSELVADGSYLVAERDGVIVGCGGWSRRRTLFGGDRAGTREAGAAVDPAHEAARIRAFFVAPDAARGGIGAALLGACEAAATAHGFTRAALMATLPGVPFYARHGYRAGPGATFDLGGVAVRFVPMEKDLLRIRNTAAVTSQID
jgi:predicted N-acetyltransferase YhbS